MPTVVEDWLAKGDVEADTPRVDDELPETMTVITEGVLELSAELLLELTSDVMEKDELVVGVELPCADIDSDTLRVVGDPSDTTIVTVADVVELSTVLSLELAKDDMERDEPLVVTSVAWEVADSETPRVIVEFPDITTVMTAGGGRRLPDVLLLRLPDEVIGADEAEVVVDPSEVPLLDPDGNAVDEAGASGVEPVPAMVSGEVVDPEREVVLDAVFCSAVVELELVCGRTVLQSTHVKRAIDEVGAGRQAGPVLWQGAPYSQQAKEVSDDFRLDAVE